MKIAQVAPLYESVPPGSYGGTERVVSYLTEELAQQGHDVTLYASGDSITAARLRPGCKRALRLDGVPAASALAQHLLMMEKKWLNRHTSLMSSISILISCHFPWSAGTTFQP